MALFNLSRSKLSLFDKDTIGEVIRFGLVGAFATAFHYLIYWLLSKWINVNIAYTIGYATSFICNFFLTSFFTFKKKASLKRGLGFGGAHLFNYLFQMVLLNLFIFLGLKKNLAPLPVYAIAIPVNFLMVRFVFKHDSKSSDRVETE